MVWFWFCDQGEQPAGAAVAMVTLRPFVVTFNSRLIEFHELKQNYFYFFLIMMQYNSERCSSPSRRINEKSVWCCGCLPCTPLRIAATAGHAACVAYLITQGAEVDLVDVKGQTALYVAVVNGHLECVRILLEAGANPNGSRHHRSTPLYHAARVGRLDILRELIR